MGEETALDLSKRINAIADIGLLYTSNNFDRERYQELKQISQMMLADELKISPGVSANIFKESIDYPTPKVDIRALVLNDDREILLVQEKADGCWSLPGGWADIGKTPSEVAVQEVFEETGVQVSCKQVMAIFDKRVHPHPPQPWYVYKMIFYCEMLPSSTQALKPAFDVLDAGWFAIDSLPPLSTDRILKEQVEVVYENIISKNLITIFD